MLQNPLVMQQMRVMMQDPAVKQRMQRMLSKLGADSGMDPTMADPAMLDKLFERMQARHELSARVAMAPLRPTDHTAARHCHAPADASTLAARWVCGGTGP